MRTIANWNMSEYVTLIIPPPQLKIEEVRYTSSSKEATAYRMGSTHSNYMAKSVIVNLSIRIYSYIVVFAVSRPVSAS